MTDDTATLLTSIRDSLANGTPPPDVINSLLPKTSERKFVGEHTARVVIEQPPLAPLMDGDVP